MYRFRDIVKYGVADQTRPCYCVECYHTSVCVYIVTMLYIYMCVCIYDILTHLHSATISSPHLAVTSVYIYIYSSSRVHTYIHCLASSSYSYGGHFVLRGIPSACCLTQECCYLIYTIAHLACTDQFSRLFKSCSLILCVVLYIYHV